MKEGWTNHWRSWLEVMALRLGTNWLPPATVNFLRESERETERERKRGGGSSKDMMAKTDIPENQSVHRLNLYFGPIEVFCLSTLPRRHRRRPLIAKVFTMDLPHHGYRASAKPRARAAPPAGDPLLFDDTSSAAPPMNSQGFYTPGYNMGGAPAGGPGGAGVNNLFADPMASAAMIYGSSLANQGKDIVNKEISRYVSVNKLKYFFAVDSKYVMKKLLLLMFPYTHQDWEVRYHRDTPLTPRHDVNAPDLYIPSMAFITYILLAGMALGIQNRFSPEVLGLCASTALVWVVIEVLVMLLSLYLLTVHSDLSTFDLIAYSGYKYVGMIFTVLGGLLFGSDGYFVALAWSSCALMFFIVRSLKMKILSSLSHDSMGAGASAKPRLRLYITVATAAFQPIIIYWLTSHLVR
uniref:Yip1 interacting factor homolog A (S. cerevisiae) n=7 Tax=Salmoninae TaxID=504568 RepID=A0A8C7V362_ONCMY